MRIRKMDCHDLDQVVQIEARTFSMPWSRDGFFQAINMPENLYLVAEEDGEILGYCGMYASFNQGEIPNVAVDEKYRNQGIAGKMLRELIRLAKKRNVEELVLEVRESNAPARHLYQKLGFEEAGVRKNFYQKPQENAVIMIRYPQIVCNCCGKRVKLRNSEGADIIPKTEFITIEKDWGYFSEKDGETHRITICESCYDKWIAGFAIEPEIRENTELM